MAVPSDLGIADDCLPTILSQLKPDDHAFLLINGATDRQLNLLKRWGSRLTIINSPTNLGIAGGRNLLLDCAMEHGFDWYHVYDVDLMAPPDYIENLKTALSSLDSENLGIVSPILLNAHQFEGAYSRRFGWYRVASSRDILDDLKSKLAQDPDSRTAFVYHAGVRDWYKHYFLLDHGPAGFDAERWLARNHEFISTSLAQGIWEVDTLPGGVHILSHHIVESGVRYAQCFNPYGYEDAEICIRAVIDRKRNLCLGLCPLIHDPRPTAPTPPPHKTTTRLLSRGKLQGYVVGRHALREFRLKSQRKEIRRVINYLRRAHPSYGFVLSVEIPLRYRWNFLLGKSIGRREAVVP